MTTDLLLAIAHNVIIFVLMALIIVELTVMLRGVTGTEITLLARLDGALGLSAVLILVVGFLRVFLGAKPEAFYLENPLFWAKIAALVVVGLLSIVPTTRFIRWARSASADPTFLPAADEAATVRRYLVMEASAFLLIPLFASLMARGYGL